MLSDKPTTRQAFDDQHPTSRQEDHLLMHSLLKRGTIFCPLLKGTVFAIKKGKKKWCRLVKGYYISALEDTIFVWNQCPLKKGHQNSAPKGTVLLTIKWCPKGTVSVLSILLSVFTGLSASGGGGAKFKTCFWSRLIDVHWTSQKKHNNQN